MPQPFYTILIADDEVELMDTLELYLVRENFKVIKAETGTQALELFREHEPDLVLLDIMMPQMDGFEVLREIRRIRKIPVVMLTARVASNDKVSGLALGADDYITKPYVLEEVIARIKAQLRRSYRYGEDLASSGREKILRSGDITLDTEKAVVTVGGEPVSFSATEIKILELLMASPGKIFTKRQIYESVWGENYVDDDNTIMVRISSIRRKLNDDPKHPSMIVTVKGLGYKFESES